MGNGRILRPLGSYKGYEVENDMDEIRIKRVENEVEKEFTNFGDVKTEFKDTARKPTLLHLQWLAERVRKVERIRKELEAGTYHVDSRDIAKALLNLR